MEMKLAEVIPIIGVVVAVIGGIIALVTYRNSTRLKRAEWIEKLHSKFYELPTYKRIRRVLDYQSVPEYENLKKGITGEHTDDELCELFVDYLNFFEYIANLWELKQLFREEILKLFDYYLRLLQQHDFIVRFIRDNGFESLEKLLKSLPVKPESTSKN